MMDEASRQDLASISYQEAINHYNQQKQSFLQSYKKAAGDLNDKIVGQYLAETFAELRQNPVEGQELIIRDIIERVSISVKEKMNNNPGYIKQLKADFKQKYNGDIEKAREAFKQDAEKLINDNELYNIIIEGLSALGSKDSLNGFQAQDIFAQMRSFTAKILLNRARGRSAKTGQGQYARIGKGYVREALVHRAFLNLVNHIDEGNKYVLHTGPIKIKSKDTAMDEFISFTNNIEESFSITAATSDGEVLPQYKGYGIQSKSWIAPWEQDNPYNRYGYSVGTRTNLLKALETEGPLEYHDWTRSIKFLARLRNTITALGPNIFYVTGRNIYWTSQLIQKMRQMNYFLTFSFNKKEHRATASIKWDTPEGE